MWRFGRRKRSTAERGHGESLELDTKKAVKDYVSYTEARSENYADIQFPINNRQHVEREMHDESSHALQKRIEEALRNEKVAPYRRTKLMVIGEGRAGKTCTINSLLNRKFNPDQDSTKGFDVKRVDTSNWQENNKSYLVEHLEGLMSVKEDPHRDLSKQDDSETRKISVTEEEVKQYGGQFVMNSKDGEGLAFSIWDFGGQKVFYSLHHLFLTDFGCYLAVFNVENLINEKTRHQALEYIKFWLFSKKLHAPLAPVILVGTHAGSLTTKELSQVNEIISQQALGNNDFNEIHHGAMSFVAIDNKDGTNVTELRMLIEAVVEKQEYIKENVPISFLRVLELLLSMKKDYLRLDETEDVMQKCGLTHDLFHTALMFLSSRGLITYFNEQETLRRFIILQPQWLISAVTDVIFDKDEHSSPDFDSKFARDFRKFCYERIMSVGLLADIWTRKGYSEDVQKFLKRVMLRSSLMCNYKFDGGNKYLIPSLFSGGKSLHNELEDGDDEYCGPFAVIDFSGNYDPEIVRDDGEIYVRYLPFGFFERLVCIAVEMSCLYSNSVKPKIGDQWAQLSFGVRIDFELRVCNDEQGRPLWIKLKSDEGTTMDEVRSLVKKGYSMIQGLRDDFFAKRAGSSKLAISLLVPSSEDTGFVLAEYNFLLKQFKDEKESIRAGQSKRSRKIRPSQVSKKKIALTAFSHWFDSTAKSSKSRPDVLTNPDQEMQVQFQKQLSFSSIAESIPLPSGLKYHCFLSYKQSSAIDIVGKQFYILSGKGYKCWYDQQLRGELNLQAMQDGVRDSMCYMLFLSKDIFPSSYVEEEVKMAVKLKKPIILVHHPDTGSVGYWQFADYIAKAPDVLKPFFSKIESIQLQRRHYLEEAVTQIIDVRLRTICAGITGDAAANGSN